MSMCRVISCVVGRGCLLWPVRSLGKTVLAFALLHSVFQGQICLLLQVFLDFLLLHSSPLKWKGHLFWVLVLKGLVGLHRTVQHQLLQHYWLGHRLGLLWYWMVCLGNEQRSFCRFWVNHTLNKMEKTNNNKSVGRSWVAGCLFVSSTLRCTGKPERPASTWHTHGWLCGLVLACGWQRKRWGKGISGWALNFALFLHSFVGWPWASSLSSLSYSSLLNWGDDTFPNTVAAQTRQDSQSDAAAHSLLAQWSLPSFHPS